MTGADELEKAVETQPDFIMIRRFGFSLRKALEKYPDGLPDTLIAQALGKPTAWVVGRYNAIVERIRNKIGA